MIDFVLPYVNCQDINWQKKYIDTRRKMDLSTEINPVRFRSWDNLQYILRGIDKFMPYIRKVHLIVSNIEQAPTWINKKKVNIVLHEDFMPEEFLPTFNSCTIEMFLNKIPDLADKFIYSNDDIFILNYLKEEELFSGNNPKLEVSRTSGTFTMYKKVLFNSAKRAALLNNKRITSTDFVKFSHSLSPFIKSDFDFVTNSLSEQIYNSCTKFREQKNFNQNLFSYYNYYSKKFNSSRRKYKYFDFTYNINDVTQEIISSIKEQKYQTICINDNVNFRTNSELEKIKKYINSALDSLLPNKCKYELGGTTKKNKKENIEKEINIKDKIDFVFPYVTSDDPYWQKIYKENVTNTNTWATGIERFRDAGTLKYLFRGIEKNMPWINKVHMIVCAKSQIPSWVDTNKVNIIEHKDFIPNEMLPTFNSTTIEMFLPNIKEISDKFIYSNDDLFPFSKSSPEYFFVNMKIPCYQITLRDIVKTAPGDLIRRNCYNLITGNKENKDRVVTTQHGPNCYKMSWLVECFEKYKTEIYNSCSKFRENKNYNQYIYAFYQMFEKIINNTEKKIISFTTNNRQINKILTEDFSKYDFVCINDDNSTTNENWKKIINKLDFIYPNKSKYEL